MIGGLELAKWLAFGAMLLDHVDLALFGRSQPWMHAIGRFALPCFAVAFGLGLARASDPLRVGARLVMPALLAQAAWAFLPSAMDPRPVNVLAGFACLAWVEGMRRLWPAAGAAAFAGLLWMSSGIEGSYVLLLIVGATVLAERARTVELHAVGALAVAVAVPSPGAFVGLAAPHLARRLEIDLPRSAGLLAWAYAAHLAVLAALAAAFH